MKGIFLMLVIATLGTYLLKAGWQEASTDLTVKELIDQLAFDKVTSVQAEIAFSNAVKVICTTNGVDSNNGFGTTEECLARFEAASPGCFDNVDGFSDKEYVDVTEFKADFSTYFHCTSEQLR